MAHYAKVLRCKIPSVVEAEKLYYGEFMKKIMCNLLMAAFVMSVGGCKCPFAKHEKILSYDVKIGSKPTVTPIPNAVDWWMPRHEAIVKRVAQGNVDMIMVGDSITHWWGNAGKTVWNKY